jgi:hypothetical protein
VLGQSLSCIRNYRLRHDLIFIFLSLQRCRARKHHILTILQAVHAWRRFLRPNVSTIASALSLLDCCDHQTFPNAYASITKSQIGIIALIRSAGSLSMDLSHTCNHKRSRAFKLPTSQGWVHAHGRAVDSVHERSIPDVKGFLRYIGRGGLRGSINAHAVRVMSVS